MGSFQINDDAFGGDGSHDKSEIKASRARPLITIVAVYSRMVANAVHKPDVYGRFCCNAAC